MKIKYSKEVDVLLIQLAEGKVHESDEAQKGIIIDYDKNGKILRIEILDASTHTDIAAKFEYEAVAA